MNEPAVEASTHRRDSIVLGLAVGLVGLTFGVLAEAAGLSLAKAMAMSVLVFTGASQFAAVGVIDSGGSPLTAVGGALFLAARNSLYGMRMSSLIGRKAPTVVAGSHFVIDETTAMSLAQTDETAAREAFWLTGVSLFVFWNLGTALGVLVGELLGDPQTLGLDAAFLASFVALMGPQLRTRPGQVASLLGAAIAVIAVPFTPAGSPILLAALAVIPALLLSSRGATSKDAE